MRLVARWALGSAEAAEDILAGRAPTSGRWSSAELRGEAQKTAATIKMVLSRALAFMTDPALARVRPARRRQRGRRHRGVPARVRGRCT